MTTRDEAIAAVRARRKAARAQQSRPLVLTEPPAGKPPRRRTAPAKRDAWVLLHRETYLWFAGTSGFDLRIYRGKLYLKDALRFRSASAARAAVASEDWQPIALGVAQAVHDTFADVSRNQVTKEEGLRRIAALLEEEGRCAESPDP